MVKLQNYLTDIDKKPLGEQYKLVSKQISNFSRLSKTKMSYEERKILLATWEKSVEFRNLLIDRIQNLRNQFSLN